MCYNKFGGFMDSIFLISSSSYRLLDEEINKIVKDNVYSSFDLNMIELDDILEEAGYISLFGEKKYIIVKNAYIFGSSKRRGNSDDQPSKKDEKLLKYLENPNPDTALIFTINGKVDSKKKICKIIKERYKFIQLEDLKSKDIFSRVDSSFKNEGYKCDSSIIYSIINNCQNNYDLTMNEVDKIKLYYSKGTIVKKDDVDNIICRIIEDNNFKFIDSVMKKNISSSFKIFDDLMIQKVEPIMLISMLANEIRNTLLVKKMLLSSNKKEIMRVLGINYDFMIDKYINNSYYFNEIELEKYLVDLCDLDYKIKKGKISNKLALEMFILEICK